METNLKLKILKSLGNVFEAGKNCKLENSIFDTLDNDLTIISEYFNINKIHSFFVAHIFVLNYKGDSVDITDLVEYFDCNPMKILEYSEMFEKLIEKCILVRSISNHHLKIALSNEQFVINEKITEAIMRNEMLPDVINKRFETIFEMLEAIYNVGERCNAKEITYSDLFKEANRIINSNLDKPIIKRIKEFELNDKNQYVLLYMIWKIINGGVDIYVSVVSEGIINRASEQKIYMQGFVDGKNKLIKQNLVELVEANFFDDTKIKLSDFTINILKETGVEIYKNKLKDDRIICPSKISSKKLYFNSEVSKQLDLLKNMLNDANLKSIQERLQNRNLPKGVAGILYGSPGTGKTETVLQIAKDTNREIMKVEISQSKSMWFGESEKKIKKIFDDYKNYAKDCELAPILFFNEADAILSKRKEISKSNVAQTENAIQNIILEELENFEGIFLATTNLIENLDQAFERRFLFKIQLLQPDADAKAKIWKSKHKKLSKKDCEMLATQFDFSGGQIDNIVRKIAISEIVNGENVDFNKIMDFCKNEKLSAKTIKVGF